MKFQVQIIGASAGTPTLTRNVSCQVVMYENYSYMLDAGEGAQTNFQKYNVRKNRIRVIAISHLHGDHVFGLIPLLCSFSMEKRQEKLFLIGPVELKEYVETNLRLSYSYITYPIEYIITNTNTYAPVYEDKYMTIYTLPLIHNVPCNGYLLVEKPRLPSILVDKISLYNLDYEDIKKIKQGEDYTTTTHEIIPNIELISPNYQRSYAYCSDTAYNESIIPMIEEVDWLYHEATWLHAVRIGKDTSPHSSAKEAAIIADKANVKNLIIGHFSPRYSDLEPLLEEAKSVFPSSYLAIEGTIFTIN